MIKHTSNPEQSHPQIPEQLHSSELHCSKTQMNLHHSFLMSHVTIIILCGGRTLGYNSYENDPNEMHALTLCIVQHATIANFFNKKLLT